MVSVKTPNERNGQTRRKYALQLGEMRSVPVTLNRGKYTLKEFASITLLEQIKDAPDGRKKLPNLFQMYDGAFNVLISKGINVCLR